MKVYTLYYDEINTKPIQLKRYINENKLEISYEIYNSLSDYFETKPKNISCKLISFELINTIQPNKNKRIIEIYDIKLEGFNNIDIVINKQLRICEQLEEYELCSKYRDLLKKWNIYGKLIGLI